MSVKVSLNAAHFKKLLAGEVVAVDGVEVALQDIGWAQIFTIVSNGMAEAAKCSVKKAERGW